MTAPGGRVQSGPPEAMTRIRLVSFLPVLLAGLPLCAQEAPTPAPELAKLKPFAGHWKGSGTATKQPGTPPTKWTADVKAEWALGNHWLMVDTGIAFASGEKMRFREYMGWDRENQRYVTLTVNNAGEGVLSTPHFAGEDTMVVMMSMLRHGSPEAERIVTKYGPDAQSFAITFLGAEGAAADAVSGKFERVAKVEPQPLEAAGTLMPADPAMAKLARMAGRFEVAGELTMAPGAPPMKIKGMDVIRTLFDGAIVQVLTTGTAEGMPGTYEAHGYFVWDATNHCYKMLMVSNMGEVMAGETRFAGDDAVVQTFTGLRMGQPYAARSVLHLDADGKPRKAVNHPCIGTAEPMQDFTCTYQAVK
jgi:hypothetical protein